MSVRNVWLYFTNFDKLYDDADFNMFNVCKKIISLKLKSLNFNYTCVFTAMQKFDCAKPFIQMRTLCLPDQGLIDVLFLFEIMGISCQQTVNQLFLAKNFPSFKTNYLKIRKRMKINSASRYNKLRKRQPTMYITML
jgi:hypothetical protein